MTENLTNEHLNINKYDTNNLVKNLPNLDMDLILKTQILDIDFIVDYILNEEYQVLESEKNIDICDVLTSQKHIDGRELHDRLF
tara:strand:- start:164 stop:415 length:252 start_codon:yes stop_codon:yes gene_type:complete